MSLDTSRARAAILGRIRAAQGRSGAITDVERAQVDAYLSNPPLAPRPTVDADVVAHFEAQAQRMSATTERISTPADAPAAIARYLSSHRLPMQAVCWPTLAGLDWAGAGLEVRAGPPTGDDRVGITGAFAGVAETGTLVLASGPDTHASTHLLPETHVAIVERARIVAHYEDAFARARSELGTLPRAFNLVSGPSRTADIEQTLVLGAHGPYRVHVLVVEHPVA